jgi:hypothetical protein
MRLCFALFAVLSAGCTDATTSAIGALGSPASIECYSGGQLIYKGKSTGRVAATGNSDGWEFKEAGSGAFLRISGACIVRN